MPRRAKQKPHTRITAQRTVVALALPPFSEPRKDETMHLRARGVFQRVPTASTAGRAGRDVSDIVPDDDAPMRQVVGPRVYCTVQ
jgi:hypothetical protein